MQRVFCCMLYAVFKVIIYAFIFKGSVRGFFISGALGPLPQRLIFTSPADVPTGRLSLSLQLPRGVCPGIRLRRCRRRPHPVRLPGLHCPLLSFSGHGAAAGPWSRQPRTLPRHLCSNVHLILLLVLQEGLGQSQGLSEQPAARPPCSLPASIRHCFSLC